MRRLKGWKIGLLMGVLLVAALSFGSSSAQPTTASAQQTEWIHHSGAQANYLSERSTHTALLPETHSIAGTSFSRTKPQRQRTGGNWHFAPLQGKCSSTIHRPQLIVTNANSSSEIWRTADYYIYALRHIII